MKRYCYIWLENYHIQLLCHRRPELKGAPLAVYDSRQQVVECNAAAEGQGVKVGMRVKEAASLLTALGLFEVPERGEEELVELGRKLLAISPGVALFEERDLVVELASAAHLFGGEEKMVRTIHAMMAEQGFGGRIGVADSLADAHLAARFGETPPTVFVRGREISMLPMECFFALPGVSPSKSDRKLFAFLGLKTLGDVARAATRISWNLLSRQTRDILLYAARDQHLSRRLAFIREEARFEDCIHFSPPVSRVSPLVFLLKNALERILTEGLAPKRLLAAGLRLVLVTETEEEQQLEILPARPTRSPGLLLELARLKLARISLTRPLARCHLVVDRCAEEVEVTPDLLAKTVRSEGSLAALMSKLDAMLNRPNALFRMAPHPALLPEQRYTQHPERQRRAFPAPAQTSSTLPLLKDHPVVVFHNSGRVRPTALESAYEFEFYDTDRHTVVKHEYFRATTGNHRRLLMKRVGEGDLQPVGLLVIEN